jgi:hypothetical protein
MYKKGSLFSDLITFLACSLLAAHACVSVAHWHIPGTVCLQVLEGACLCSNGYIHSDMGQDTDYSEGDSYRFS